MMTTTKRSMPTNRTSPCGGGVLPSGILAQTIRKECADMMRIMLWSILLLPTLALSDLDEFFEFPQESVDEVNNELGRNAAAYWGHNDLADEDSAPVISFRIYTLEETPDDVGSFTTLRDLLRGKSKLEKNLYVQQWLGNNFSTEDVLVYMLSRFDIFEDDSAFMFVSNYIDNEGTAYTQYQVLQWAEDESAKCVLASDIEHGHSASYEDDIIGALTDLMAVCTAGLDTDDDPPVSGT